MAVSKAEIENGTTRAAEVAEKVARPSVNLTAQMVEEACRTLEPEGPEAVLRWAVERFFPHVGLTCSFQPDDLAIAHMLLGINPQVPLIFLNTGFHFQETLEFRDQFVERYGLRLIEVLPALTVEEQEARCGPALYARDPDRCCWMRKVEPLQRVLGGLDAWITGIRRDQAPTRAAAQVLELHRTPGGRTLLKVNPLAAWTRRQVLGYLEAHQVPIHPLLERGYLSIGCRPCTRPVAPGESERSGRWAGLGKTECGLHTFTQKGS